MDEGSLSQAWVAGVWDTGGTLRFQWSKSGTVVVRVGVRAPLKTLRTLARILDIPLQMVDRRVRSHGHLVIPARAHLRLARLANPYAVRGNELETIMAFSETMDQEKRKALALIFNQLQRAQEGA